MAQKTPDQITAKFRDRLAAAATDYAAGVQNPSREWASATVAGAARWRAGINKAIQERSFERGVQSAGNAKWQQRAATVGAQHFSAAADQAAQSYAQKAAQIMQAAAAARSAALSMPDETIEQRIARSAAAQRAISQFWAGRKTG